MYFYVKKLIPSFVFLCVLSFGPTAWTQFVSERAATPRFSPCSDDQVVQVWMDTYLARPVQYQCEQIDFNKKPSLRNPPLELLKKFDELLKDSYTISRDTFLTAIDTGQLKYKELPFFLPKQFIYLSSREKAVAEFMDQMILKILETQYGKQLCYNEVNMRTSFLKAFGLSPKSQLQARVYCGKRNAGAMTSFWDPIHEDDLTSEKYDKRVREFIFIVSNQINVPLQSWTNSYGVTYFLIEPSALEEPLHLYEMIIHELYIVSDLYSSEPKKFIEKFKYSVDGLRNLDKFHQALLNPFIKYSMAAQRAYVFESWVLWDMGFPVERIKSTPKKCIFGVLDLLPQLYEASEIFASELEKSPLSLADSIEVLSENSNLCSNLYLPMTSMVFLGGTAGSGPRPRVGGSWGNSMQAVNSDNQSATFNSQDLAVKVSKFKNFQSGENLKEQQDRSFLDFKKTLIEVELNSLKKLKDAK